MLVAVDWMWVEVDAELQPFLTVGDRGGRPAVRADATLGHVVESLGIPLPEVGRLDIDGHEVPPSYRPRPGELARVHAVRRPQALPIDPPRFLLDVHLGTLARRLRLVGVDAAYGNDLDDDTLIAQSNAERRVLLTQDRALLYRRTLWLGAYVRGSRPDDQFADVLTRFAPPLAPWTRCTACNGRLIPVSKQDIGPLLQPGTRRTYDTFARCASCGHIYWRGAHHDHLEAIVAQALHLVAAA
jgi:Uncharacterized conserved protein